MELWEFKGGITSSEKKKLFYGWKIVGAGPLFKDMHRLYFGEIHSIFDPIVESLGWSRALTAAECLFKV